MWGSHRRGWEDRETEVRCYAEPWGRGVLGWGMGQSETAKEKGSNKILDGTHRSNGEAQREALAGSAASLPVHHTSFTLR